MAMGNSKGIVKSINLEPTDAAKYLILLAKNEYTLKEISKITGVKIGTVNDIKHHRQRKKIALKYGI